MSSMHKSSMTISCAEGEEKGLEEEKRMDSTLIKIIKTGKGECFSVLSS